MARLQAQQSIDSYSIDLNFYSRFYYDHEFLNNINYWFAGRTYEDVYLVNGYDGYNDLVVGFFGSGIGFNSAGHVDRGTITALGEATYSGLDLWYIQDISVSAARVYSASATSGNADDRVLLSQILAGNDTIELSDFNDRFEGWAGNDRMFGNGGSDTLYGGAGNDSLYGGAGNDVIDGGAGNDVLVGGSGADRLIGGAGNDLYVVTAGDVITEYAGGGTDRVEAAVSWTLGGHLENLTLTGTANITGTGNNLANTIQGNSGNNSILGGAGNDRLFGNAGNDRLVGGAGNDTLYAGAGADTLVGSGGRDMLYGGSGPARDVFVFNAVSDSQVGTQRDQIFQFQVGRDDIDVSKIDANIRSVGNQRFGFSGTEADENSIWYSRQSGGVVVRGDVNGDGRADFEIWVDGIARLNEADFIL